LNILRARVKNLSAYVTLNGQALDKDILEIVSQGGMLSLLKTMAEKERLKNL